METSDTGAQPKPPIVFTEWPRSKRPKKPRADGQQAESFERKWSGIESLLIEKHRIAAVEESLRVNISIIERGIRKAVGFVLLYRVNFTDTDSEDDRRAGEVIHSLIQAERALKGSLSAPARGANRRPDSWEVSEGFGRELSFERKLLQAIFRTDGEEGGTSLENEDES